MSFTVSLDSSGRLVLPKGLRDKLNLRTGSKLRAEILNDRLELTPESGGVSILKKGKLLVIASSTSLSDGALRQAIQDERQNRSASVLGS